MSTGQEKIYQMITDLITDQLEKGVVPWHKPWSGGPAGAPRNLVSGKAYRGINSILLQSLGFNSRYFLSYKQATEARVKELRADGKTIEERTNSRGKKYFYNVTDGQGVTGITKGAKSCPVVFWNWIEVEPETENRKAKKIPFMKYYRVFNLDQTTVTDPDGVPDMDVIAFDDIAEAREIVENMPQRPDIQHEQQRAFYRPATDLINMPVPESFESEPDYYATLFHELSHSTGHQSRLNRRSEGAGMFGGTAYSKEELVAEMGAAFLCGCAGISPATIDNSAAYIQNWLQALKNNKKWLVQAAQQAQKSTDFILDV